MIAIKNMATDPYNWDSQYFANYTTETGIYLHFLAYLRAVHCEVRPTQKRASASRIWIQTIAITLQGTDHLSYPGN